MDATIIDEMKRAGRKPSETQESRWRSSIAMCRRVISPRGGGENRNDVKDDNDVQIKSKRCQNLELENLRVLAPLAVCSLMKVESAYQQHLMRGEATEELLQMGQTNAALDILAQKWVVSQSSCQSIGRSLLRGSALYCFAMWCNLLLFFWVFQPVGPVLTLIPTSFASLIILDAVSVYPSYRSPLLLPPPTGESGTDCGSRQQSKARGLRLWPSTPVFA